MKLFMAAVVLLFPMYQYAQSSTKGDVNAMLTALKSRTISRVEVLRIPDDVTTIVAVTTEYLRKSPSYTIVMNSGFEPSLESLLSGMSSEQSAMTSDLRWGLLLFDKSGHEVGSVFIDQFGMNGYLNGKSVSFSVNMARRMRKFIQELR